MTELQRNRSGGRLAGTAGRAWELRRYWLLPLLLLLTLLLIVVVAGTSQPLGPMRYEPF